MPRRSERRGISLWLAGAGGGMAALLVLAGAYILWPHLAPQAAMAPPQIAAIAPAPPVAPAPGPPAPFASAPVAPAPVPSAPGAPLPPTASPISVQNLPSPLTSPPPNAADPTLAAPLATEAQIDADQPDRLRVFRFAPNPAVVALDFASLATQGEMLNRVAAFIEKDGLPHDHLLADAALTDAIRASGATPETYYYGHDYRAADLARFFLVGDRDHIAFNAEEEWLRGLVRRLGWMAPNAVGALITLPRLGADSVVDVSARRTILHHELSHGEYFTNPAYADYVAAFWQNVLTPAERGQFRKFLAEDGYDPRVEDLMINEMQAYLMHTRDPRFFSSRVVGLSPDRMADLQARFLLDMPHGWLRDCTPPPGVAARAP